MVKEIAQENIFNKINHLINSKKLTLCTNIISKIVLLNVLAIISFTPIVSLTASFSSIITNFFILSDQIYLITKITILFFTNILSTTIGSSLIIHIIGGFMLGRISKKDAIIPSICLFIKFLLIGYLFSISVGVLSSLGPIVGRIFFLKKSSSLIKKITSATFPVIISSFLSIHFFSTFTGFMWGTCSSYNKRYSKKLNS
ncbi:MAG: hypothetical protein AMS24_00640 [Chlamydiae bacterium SM23_39]|nr:MAG: hypothetical protein AMS24_00640 [Chlamydiae bacterium SM23_39]